MNLSLKLIMLFLIFNLCFFLSAHELSEERLIDYYELSDILLNKGFDKVEVFTDKPPRISYTPYIKASVNGFEGTFILDMGAFSTQLDKSYCDKVGLKYTHYEENDHFCLDSAEVKISIGVNEFNFESIVIRDFTNMNEWNEEVGFNKIDGLIGADLITSNHVVFDYNSMNFFIRSQKNDHGYIDGIGEIKDQLITMGYSHVEMSQESGQFFGEITVNKIKGRFIIDTGTNGTILDRNLSEKFNLVLVEKENYATLISDKQKLATTNSQVLIEIGNTEFFVEPGFLNLDGINKSLESDGVQRIDGILGADILRKTIIDCVNMMLFVK